MLVLLWWCEHGLDNHFLYTFVGGTHLVDSLVNTSFVSRLNEHLSEHFLGGFLSEHLSEHFSEHLSEHFCEHLSEHFFFHTPTPSFGRNRIALVLKDLALFRCFSKDKFRLEVTLSGSL